MHFKAKKSVFTIRIKQQLVVSFLVLIKKINNFSLPPTLMLQREQLEQLPNLTIQNIIICSKFLRILSFVPV